jgi:hypothetical protein
MGYVVLDAGQEFFAKRVTGIWRDFMCTGDTFTVIDSS